MLASLLETVWVKHGLPPRPREVGPYRFHPIPNCSQNQVTVVEKHTELTPPPCGPRTSFTTADGAFSGQSTTVTGSEWWRRPGRGGCLLLPESAPGAPPKT